MLKDLERMHEVILEADKVTLALSGVDIETLDLPLPMGHLPI